MSTGMEAAMRFVVRCRPALAAAVADLAAAGRVGERAWWEVWRSTPPADSSAAARAAWMARGQAEFEAAQAAGLLRGTRATVLAPALREELAARGWLGESWRPVPAGVQSRKARRWGTEDRRWEARVTLDVAEDLAVPLVRGCYWTSAPAVAALQEWVDVHGERWRNVEVEGRVWGGRGPRNSELVERDRHRAEIVTTAMVLRSALCRATDLDVRVHV